MLSSIKQFLLFSILSILIPFISLAQSATVSGEVRDSASKQGIELATISLINQSGKVAAITTSDKTGKFSLAINSEGVYTVAVEFLGYKKKMFANVLIQKKAALGVIVLQPFGNNLQEVTVTGQSNGLKIKNDKQVFKASQFDNAKGGTAIDLIKKLAFGSCKCPRGCYASWFG